MKMHLEDFRVKQDTEVKLDNWPTRVEPFYRSKKHYQALLDQGVESLRKLQPILYANGRYALLIILQALDAAGKDSAIKHIMSGVNPQGCMVFSFRQPGPEALAHDFLWQAVRLLPERGRIGIFNRSYYEEVLVVRVHPDLLRAERLPADERGRDAFWAARYRSIRALERHLNENGTRVIKFFLHISAEEQRKRLLARLDDREKNWKFNEADIEERKCWEDYMKAYEQCLSETSTKDAPWYAVPADDKRNARLIISGVIIETLESLDLTYPKLEPARRKQLRKIRRNLESKDS